MATTAATGSPCQRTLSTASGYCGADFRPFKCVRTPTQGVQCAAKSGPVATATTPGIARASAVSIRTIHAWAWGERRNAAWTMRGSTRSLTYWPRPCVSRPRFGRGSARPI